MTIEATIASMGSKATYTGAGVTIAVAVQVAFGLWLGDWFAGAALACTWFVAREHTQAEYRWIAKFGNGKRANLTAMGWADKRIWNFGSVLDFAAPIAACVAVYFFQSFI